MSRSSMARHRKQTAYLLRMLLSERGAYRSQWARLARKTPPGEVSQAAVARVIADHLQQTGNTASHTDVRFLKDRVCRAFTGRALTPETLDLFTAAFKFSEQDTRQLWAAILGTTPDEAQAVCEPVSFRIDWLRETLEVNAIGSPLSQRAVQQVTAGADGLSRLPLRFDTHPSAITVSVGEVSDIRRSPESGLPFTADVTFPKPLRSGQSAVVNYAVAYPVHAKAVTEFMRTVVGTRIDNLTMTVKFDRHKLLPGTVWWLVSSDVGGLGRTLCCEPVRIDRRNGMVSKTVTQISDVAVGFRWEW